MLTPTRLRSLGCPWALECLWALKWLRVLEWLGIHATKIFKNLVDKNDYDKTTLIPAFHLQSFYRFFVNTNFRNFFTLSVILKISRKLQQVPDHIECPSCVEYPINSDIRSRDGYPIVSGIRSCGQVSDYFGERPKPDPNIGYPNLSGTRTPLDVSFDVQFVFL